MTDHVAIENPPLAAHHGKPGTQTPSPAELDEDMQAVLDAYAQLDAQPIETLDAQAARQQPTLVDAVNAVLKQRGKYTQPEAQILDVTRHDLRIPGAVEELSAFVYTPTGSGPFPVVVYFHGGGFVIADKTVYDSSARGLSKYAQAVVVSADYRRAPEARFPAQHEDALAVYRWAVHHASSLNGDPQRIAIAGESAGGNLALATAMAAAQAGLPKPRHVLAVYPLTQVSDLDTPSYQDSATAKPLNKAMMQWFAQMALDENATTDPRIDLLHADLKSLPPVTLITAQIDPLRSDSELLERALLDAGVPVEHKAYLGVTHEFFGLAAAVRTAQDAQVYAGKRLLASLQEAALESTSAIGGASGELQGLSPP